MEEEDRVGGVAPLLHLIIPYERGTSQQTRRINQSTPSLRAGRRKKEKLTPISLEKDVLQIRRELPRVKLQRLIREGVKGLGSVEEEGRCVPVVVYVSEVDVALFFGTEDAISRYIDSKQVRRRGFSEVRKQERAGAGHAERERERD